VFNFFRPGYVPPATALTPGAVAPEFQLVNESSVGGYLNYLQTVISNGISSGAYGPITQVLQNRYEAYVAPGYRLGYSTLAFIKIGVMDIPTKAPIDTSGVQTLSGGPNSVGLLYGAGITQKLSPNSPYFLKLEYTGGQTKNAYTVDANLNQYLSKIMYGSASASLGFSF